MRHFRLTYNWGYGLLSVALIVFFVSMSLSLSRIKASHVSDTRITASNLWSIAQANYELLRLSNALDAYALGAGDTSHDDLIDRFDIFWSRLPVLVDGADGEQVVAISDAEHIVPRLLERLRQLEPALFEIEPGDRAAHQSLREQLDAFGPSLHRLMLQVNSAYATETSARTQAIDRMYDSHRIYQLAILVSGGVFILFLLRETRAARRARHEAVVARNQLGAVIDALPVMISVTDRASRFVLMNRYQREVHGIDETAVIGRTAEELGLDEGQHDRLDREVLDAGAEVPMFEETRADADGSGRTWLTTKVPVRNDAGEAQQVVSVSMDITERKAAEARVRHMALHDPLTGLPNRLLFSDRLAQQLRHARRHGYGVAVQILDFDDFKAINDTLGHPVADALLVAAAERLERSVRESDTLARIGSDEFAIVQTNLEDPSGATRLAEDLQAVMARPFVIEGHEVATSISIGISLSPQDGTVPGELIKHADVALRHAKAQARGSHRFFRRTMNERARRRRELEAQLRLALEHDAFELHYQPKFELPARRPCGLEALLRWPHPERGLIPPDDFIPVAEETGLILSLGAFALHAACAQNRRWQDAGLSPVPVAVNLSAAQFARHDLVGSIRRTLHATGLDPALLELEITESVLVRNPAQVSAILQAIRNLGVTITLDDFGTGYSSLSYLHRFPIDKLKIDKSFVQRIGQDQSSSSIVEAILSLARTLDLRTVAEGIETEAQLLWLEERGCDEAQGFHTGRPVPHALAARWLHAPASATRLAETA